VAALVALTVALRLGWIALVPTVPRSDYEMYWRQAEHLVQHGALDPGLVTMPGWVALLALVQRLGGGLLAAKLLGVAFAGLGAAALHALVAPLAGRRTATVATALYAVWPAGVALASVLGTDIPFLTVLLGALLVLARRIEIAAAPVRFEVLGPGPAAGLYRLDLGTATGPPLSLLLPHAGGPLGSRLELPAPPLTITSAEVTGQ
jgi:hypothetical protein